MVMRGCSYVTVGLFGLYSDDPCLGQKALRLLDITALIQSITQQGAVVERAGGFVFVIILSCITTPFPDIRLAHFPSFQKSPRMIADGNFDRARASQTPFTHF
ncbi:hypothetical protein BDQ12DRAFT_674102 [Crucibulum laeve]|uniref:Uncharacterized protein n=1 Tax=Crucibulum laeve TaxID=68775 RepID=A0A5C3MI26_9AGAR|nr:hypothetical protein BDQ12DRAFT_674102 [Crucibulum laeve]